MLASCKLDKPQEVIEYKLQIDRKALGKTFKAEQKKVQTCQRHTYESCSPQDRGGRGTAGSARARTRADWWESCSSLEIWLVL